MWRVPWLAAAVLAVLLAGASPGAQADGLADEADLHFERGAQCYAKGDYPCALEHFLLSGRLVPNRNVVYNVARTYARMGRFADAHRYYVDALVGETDAAVSAEIEAAIAQIAARVGVLRVATEPPGATIYLDRRDLGSRGRTPRPLAVVPGRYRILVELARYEPEESREIEVGTGQEVAVPFALRRILGTVRVAIEGAPDAVVHVADERAPAACRAPCDFELPPGTHLLYFTREGYRAAARQVLVAAKQVVHTTARLDPLSGSLLVEADERGAVVEIDGKPMGFTPAVVQNVMVGRRRVRLSLRGYKPLERTVEILPGQQVDLRGLRLDPLHQVTAVSRYAEEIDDAPSSLTIIDGQELRAFGYPTIAEALRGVRGVYLSNDYAYSSAGVRALGQPNDYGNRLLVLADGHSTNDDIINSSYIGTDARADLHDVERIEVVRGPGSLLYGTGAVSGVVNLVTRPRDEPSGVQGSFGTWGNGVARARAGLRYRLGPEAGAWASVSGSRSDGIGVPVALTDPAGGAAVQTAGGADGHRALTTAGHVWWGPLEAQWFHHERAQRVPVGAYAARFGDPRSVLKDARTFGEIRFEPRISDAVALFTRVHVNHYAYDGFVVAPQGADWAEQYNGAWFGAEARVVVTPIEALRLVAGGEGQFHPLVSMYGEGRGPDGQPIPGSIYLDERRSFGLGAAYALLDASPVAWFRLSAGARVDLYSTLGPIVVPRGALIFKPVPGGVLKLMSGRAFRAPSIYEQYYEDNGVSQVGATGLGPESIVSNEIEYTQHFARDWSVTGAAHASFVEDIVDTELVPGKSDVIRYVNSDDPVLAMGGELEIRRQWRRGWMLAGFYGLQQARYLDPDNPQRAANPRLVNAPEHLAGLRAVVPVVPDLATVAARAALEAPRRVSLDSSEATGWAVVADLALSGGSPDHGIRYVVGVYNLFDWQWAVPVDETFASSTMRQPGRTFLAEVSLAFP
ncbi:MAG: TonB-dependent receptor [Deltaproteobacteria bacterium]|nr:TonB-dependent receptor [Deltaproteobacteria bacterium]